MLNLRRDLYSRMALSAQKSKELNKQFKYTPPSIIRRENIVVLPEKSLEISLEKRIPEVQSKFYKVPMRSKKTEKMDEKIDKMINNPQLLELKKELQVAEELLNRIKLVDRTNPKIKIIEQTISRIKTLIDEKMYV